MTKFCSKKLILTTVFCVSLAVRCTVFFSFLTSPFRYFHRVPGLDMETLLRFSAWERSNEFNPLFVVHRFIIYFVWLLNGKVHCIPAVVLIQNLAGAAGALLIADLVLMLWGKRIIALLAGVFYTLYSVLLLYDFCILQESITTFLILLGIWSFVRSRVRHYPSNQTFSSGILLGLCSVGRPVAAPLAVILSVKTFFEGKRKAAFLLLAGILTLWLTAGAFNGFFSKNGVFSKDFFPFFKTMNYAVAFHAEQSAKTLPQKSVSLPASAAESGIRRMITGLPARAARFFLIHEIPENLNFYFLRTRIFPLRYLPGPELLLPAALAGIFLMFLRLKHRESLILLILLLLALPLAVREPIGRYRLHLVPYLVLSAAYFFVVLERNTKRSHLLCGGALALSLAVNFVFSSSAFTRSSDHVAWGRALEIQNSGRPVPDSLREFYLGWQKSGHSDRAAAVNLITSALRIGDAKTAVRTCQEGIAGPAGEKSVYHYYLALIYASVKNFTLAEKELALVKESEIPALRKKIIFLRQVVQRKSF